MLAMLFIFSLVFFAVVYRIHGRYMARIYDLNDDNPTPAETMYDGIDYCPAHPAVLLGHHFASIAGAGPIVGPITAASMFGWLPAYLWCLLGSSFLGGPHDIGTLVSSMRHNGKSVGEVVDHWVGKRGKFFFLVFTILTLILVVAVFLQLSANTFAADTAVAFSSVLYIFMAVIFGVLVYKYNTPLCLMTLVIRVPVVMEPAGTERCTWVAGVFTIPLAHMAMGYCCLFLLASVLPVWFCGSTGTILHHSSFFSQYCGAIGMVSAENSEVQLRFKDVSRAINICAHAFCHSGLCGISGFPPCKKRYDFKTARVRQTAPWSGSGIDAS